MAHESYHVDEEQLVKAAKTALEAGTGPKGGVTRNVTARFAFVGSKTGKKDTNTGTACHGGMARYKDNMDYTFKGDDAPFLVSWTMYNLHGKVIPREHTIRYYDYLLNRSPWAPIFLIKDPEYVYENGMAVRLDFPHPLVAGACIAFRHGYEKVKYMQQWNLFVSNGMQEDLAFLYMVSMAPVGNVLTFTSVEYMHMSINAWYDAAGTRKFLSHDLSTDQPTYLSRGSYSGINDFWGSTPHVDVIIKRRPGHVPTAACLYDFNVGQEKEKEERETQSLNIFAEYRKRQGIQARNGGNTHRVYKLDLERVKEFSEHVNGWFDKFIASKKGAQDRAAA